MSKATPSIMEKVWVLEAQVDRQSGLIRDLTTCLANRNRELKACCESIDTFVQLVEQVFPIPGSRGIADLILFQGRAALADAFEGNRPLPKGPRSVADDGKRAVHTQETSHV